MLENARRQGLITTGVWRLCRGLFVKCGEPCKSIQRGLCRLAPVITAIVLGGRTPKDSSCTTCFSLGQWRKGALFRIRFAAVDISADPTLIVMDVPKPGEWPVGPQEDQEPRKDRIWVDGCFDFAHHGRFDYNHW